MVKALDVNKKDVYFRCHIGGGRYVSVTSGKLCRFSEILLSIGYRRDKAHAIRSTPPPSWVVEVVDDACPALAIAVTCYTGDDHLKRLGALQCPECNPFETEWTDCSNKFGCVWLNIDCTISHATVAILSRLIRVVLSKLNSHIPIYAFIVIIISYGEVADFHSQVIFYRFMYVDSSYVCLNSRVSWKRKIAEAINNDHPVLAAAIPCYLQEDH